MKKKMTVKGPYRDGKWRTIKCGLCVNGIEPTVGTEAVPCKECGGDGVLWVRPSGHLFQYPGGPARGAPDPRAYERGTPQPAFELFVAPEERTA